jgi:hypothetical protein
MKEKYPRKPHSATRVRALMPTFGPKFPSMSPAETLAMTPDSCKDCASK